MSKSITVTLAGTEFTVPKLNLGQQREITRLFSSPAADISFDILAIAFRRAEPKVLDLNALEPDFDEISKAVGAILETAGLKKSESPPAPAAATLPAA
jgi:hypothetical protein